MSKTIPTPTVKNTGTVFQILKLCPKCQKSLYSNTVQEYCMKHGYIREYIYHDCALWERGYKRKTKEKEIGWEKGGEG